MTDLERVTARAIECGADDSCGTFHFWPQELLAFEQATLKEAVIAVEAIDAGLLSAQAETIEQLQSEKAMLVDSLERRCLTANEEVLIEEIGNLTAKLAMQAELLEEAAEDVSEWGNYADDYFKEKWNLDGDIKKYKDAAKATQADVAAWEDKRYAELKEKYDINEASNKAVELALEDVPYKGSYADGIEYLKARVAKLEDALALIRDPHTEHPLFALTDLPLELCYEAIAAEALRGESK